MHNPEPRERCAGFVPAWSWRVLLVVLLTGSLSWKSHAQTAFISFNTVGQYTNNFSPWGDNGSGANDGNYSFQESTTDGVAGGGGVSVFTNNDTTAVYKTSSWNLATNGANATVSVMVFANGQTSGSKVQVGVINSTTNGFNSNTGVQFESFRSVPSSATNWTFYEQYRTANTLTTSAALGTANVIAGHWYKFVVTVTNTSGAPGNIGASCALYDYGTAGTTPGSNGITFSTVETHSGLNIATNTAVYPGIRAFQNAGISAFDNFLVFTSNSSPVFTLPLNNVTVPVGSPYTFSVLADGPGSISYTWYTNGTVVSGFNGSNYTITASSNMFTNISVVAGNANGIASTSATVTPLALMTPIALTGFNRDVVIENTASGPPYSAYAQEFNAGEGTCFYQHGLTGTSYGMPLNGSFSSVIDGSIFQFQPYTNNNALVMSADTSVNNGTLTLITPATYGSITMIANSASATATSTGILTLNFGDGSTFVTNYNCFDWFFNPGFALQGVDRINISSGAPQGTSTDPRFYQTTLNLAAIMGASNQTLVSMNFTQATNGKSTAVYAVSGTVTTNSFILATVTNSPAIGIQSTAASLAGQVLSTGSHAPQINIYYGTNDGGTNFAAWQYYTTAGFQSGSFNATVTNLNPSTTYYFTCRAVNSAGVSWASPSQLFTTLAPVQAQVVNIPATNITANTATIAADVVSTGGNTPVVTIYYGTSNGGSNPSNWNGSFNLGPESGYCAVTVPGLSPSTGYYFTAQASNSDGIVWASPAQSFTTLATNPPSKLVSVVTYHNDNTRDGANTNETQLTPANVNTNTFGKLFSYSVDGYVFAQPLIATNVVIPGKGLHNVVYVVTENDSIYAFDADSQQGPNANPLWQVSFINPSAGITTIPNSVVGTSDISPEVGSTATPVIDTSSGTIYLEVKTMEVSGGVTNFVHRLHALDMTTGNERTTGIVANSPVIIAATNYPGNGDGQSNDTDGSGHVLWNPMREHSRPALTLLNGVLYIAFASHGDNNPYHGWLFSYDAHTLAQISVYCTTPNGLRGGIWQGGGGATVDESGNLFYITGNGNASTDFNATGSTFSTTNNFAMTVLKFVPSNGIPVLTDFFTPYNQASLTSADADFGSGAALALPDYVGSSAHPHLLAAAGKGGKIYLIDRDNMGHFNASGDTQIVQVLTNALGSSGQNGSYMTPAFFNSTLYYIGMNSTLMAFTMSNAAINTPPVQTSTVYGDKGSSSPSISANGRSNAICWAIESDAYASSGPAILHAYNANNVAQELYNSSQISARDYPGGAVKFTVPTVANGKVYMGTEYELSVFGLGSFLPAPLIAPAGGLFTNSVTISFSDAVAGASFFYTLDGSIPSSNSIPYSGPFALTNTAVVQVIAFANGASSPVTSADFVNSSAFGSGTGLVGSYFSNQVATFNPPASLVRTDTMVNFNWQNSSPAPSVGSNNYSVMWTGCVQPQYTESYTFYTFTDAGVRLWINGQLLIDHLSNQPPTQWTASIPMVAQQLYNIRMEYFYGTNGSPVAQLSWGSPSTSTGTIPQSQLYPVTNPPPAVALLSPTNGQHCTAAASVTLLANAAAQSNAVSEVAFYINNTLFGVSSNAPYAVTAAGLAPGNYTITAVATDTTGLAGTSAPVNITVVSGSGLAYGMTNYPASPAFYNMPGAFNLASTPLVLSQTGVFSNTPNMSPAASLISYSPNVPLWSDGALKTRYFSVPNSGAPLNPGEQIAFAPTGTWSFPAGTVFVKTFELVTNQSNPNSIHRLETRLIVRDTNGAVYGVTYKWRPDNSDADLLTNSLTESIQITTTNGVITQNWYYPSPSDCLQCHTPVANYVLGLNARQLNGNLRYPNGVTDNQLRAINRTGLFYPAIDESSISNIEMLFSLTNQTASYQQRARSYFDANCAQCHQPGGTGPTFDARFDTPLTNQNIIYGVLSKGNLGYDNAYVVTPDDAWRSILWDRINSTNDSIKMPPLARNLIDTNAVAVIADWINSLPGTPALPPPVIAPAGGTYTGYANVALQSQAPNTTLYYTLDGSLPNTNSLRYTGPFLVTSNETVSASAWESGYVNSVAASASFTMLPGVFFGPQNEYANGTFQMTVWGPLGYHYILQTSTNLTQWTPISTNSPSTVPFTLTDTHAGGAKRFYRVVQTQ